jgi:hypothetical protein
MQKRRMVIQVLKAVPAQYRIGERHDEFRGALIGSPVAGSVLIPATLSAWSRGRIERPEHPN